MRFAGHTLQIRETRSERVEKTVISGLGKPTTTPSISDKSGHLLAELSGSDSTEIIWLEDLPVAVKRAGAVHYTHADHLGTPRAVVTSGTASKAIWQWDFLGTASGSNAFGDLEANADPDADGTHFIFDLRFPGQQKDQTGLNYNYFRDYEPGTGRYVESDPIGLEGGVNTFGYVGASPTRHVDAKGLWVPIVVLGICWGGGCELALGAVATSTALMIVNNPVRSDPWDPNRDWSVPCAPKPEPPQGDDCGKLLDGCIARGTNRIFCWASFLVCAFNS